MLRGFDPFSTSVWFAYFSAAGAVESFAGSVCVDKGLGEVDIDAGITGAVGADFFTVSRYSA